MRVISLGLWFIFGVIAVYIITSGLILLYQHVFEPGKVVATASTAQAKQQAGTADVQATADAAVAATVASANVKNAVQPAGTAAPQPAITPFTFDPPSRKESGPGKWLEFQAGQPVAGSIIELSNGRVFRTCGYYFGAPMNGRVNSGVVHPGPDDPKVEECPR